MIGALLQLHHDIEEGHLSPALRVQRLKVPREDVLVDLLLQRRQVRPHNKLRLGGHVLQHVRLHATQHVRPQQLMQLPHLLLLRDILEGRLEARQIVELGRREEVQQVEELLQVVLQRRARQQHLVVERVVGEDPEELGLVVLEPVGLVHDEDLPLDGAEAGRVDGDELVGGEQHVELHRARLDAGLAIKNPHKKPQKAT